MLSNPQPHTLGEEYSYSSEPRLIVTYEGLIMDCTLLNHWIIELRINIDELRIHALSFGQINGPKRNFTIPLFIFIPLLRMLSVVGLILMNGVFIIVFTHDINELQTT